MGSFRKKVYAAAGYNTVFFGPGRKEFNPKISMPPMEHYIQEAANGVLAKLPQTNIDEGIIGSFMAGQFLKQGNLPGFLPFIVPTLKGKPCSAIEGACGTGGRAIAMGMRSILSDLADSVFVCCFEIQNNMKSVYGADLLAGAGYYSKERKGGHAFFFPGVFSDRAGAYYEKYGRNLTREAMAAWYEQAILNARKNPKAQEFHNTVKDLKALAMAPLDPKKFVPNLNLYNCSKISDGASALMLFSEKGLAEFGIDKNDAIEIIAIGEAQGDLTLAPEEPSELRTTALSAKKAFAMADIDIDSIGILEAHDCFAITAIMTLEAIGAADIGKASRMIIEGETLVDGFFPVNPSGGLCGFGHPTGASGIRQMVDLLAQLTGQADNQVDLKKPLGMMVSMGGNDKTVTSFIVQAAS